jgi:broad specificity phosphatase PhoE
VPPLTTWLVRHGQSEANADLPVSGNAEVPLTDLGRQQARALAERVCRQPDLLVCSPFLRARATAEVILERWPATSVETWPIEELTYLSPARCEGTTAASRRPMIDAYWQRCDPLYSDGPDAESFRTFIDRLQDFGRRLIALDADFVIVVGHGQFFRAYLMGMASGFAATAEWMRQYRTTEVGNSMANGEIVELRAT